MTWVRLDDVTPLHPKLLDAGANAAWLWVAGLAHCNRHATDGRIAKQHVPALYPPLAAVSAELADKLVELELWHDRDGSYVVHDYDEYQGEALRDVRDARRDAARERKRKQRERERQESADTKSHHVTDRDASRSRAAPSRSKITKTRAATTLGATTSPRAEVAKAESLQASPAGQQSVMSQLPVPTRPGPSRPEIPIALTVAPHGDEFDVFTAQRMRTLFQARYLAARGVDPSLGGKNLGDFHARVVATSRARQRDAEQLFVEAVDAWLKRDLTPVERRAPYACFAQAWGELVDARVATRDVRKGFVEPAPPEAFTDPEVSPEELFGLIVPAEEKRV